jgi:CheY-like chemotaxis protein
VTNKLILIVDDQEDNRIVFAAILTHHGHDVFVAENGAEAVEQVRSHAPDLVLMDLQMPGIDGWEATRLLKQDPATASIPVLAVTAQDHEVFRLREAGFCAYVRKPVRPQALLRLIAICLDGLEESEWVDLPSPNTLTLEA